MSTDLHLSLKQFWNTYSSLTPLLKDLKAAHARAYLVGGAVRDLVMCNPKIKDCDIEVHAISEELLQTILKKYGVVSLVGKQFGVFRLAGFDVDWSLPRTDSAGRKPKVTIDPSMTIERALRRRDVTMNAMAIDLTACLDNHEKAALIDPYGGYDSIKNRIMRAVDPTLFVEDPLRFFRVVHFIGRFEMKADHELERLCKTIDISGVARERIFDEIKKLFLKSRAPSQGIRFIDSCGRLEQNMPELAALKGVYQIERYHPEGDVYEHSLQSLDAAAALACYGDDEEKLISMFGALCHDFGKVDTTDAHGHAYGHEVSGCPKALSFMRRFSADVLLNESVVLLVRYHMTPFMLVKQNSSFQAYKRLAKKVAPLLSLHSLSLIALADTRGRNPNGHEPLKDGLELFTLFLYRASLAQVTTHPEPPLLKGQHLLDTVKPGPYLGTLLHRAYEIQIEENIHDIDELKRRVLTEE